MASGTRAPIGPSKLPRMSATLRTTKYDSSLDASHAWSRYRGRLGDAVSRLASSSQIDPEVD